MRLPAVVCAGRLATQSKLHLLQRCYVVQLHWGQTLGSNTSQALHLCVDQVPQRFPRGRLVLVLQPFAGRCVL